MTSCDVIISRHDVTLNFCNVMSIVYQVLCVTRFESIAVDFSASIHDRHMKFGQNFGHKILSTEKSRFCHFYKNVQGSQIDNLAPPPPPQPPC